MMERRLLGTLGLAAGALLTSQAQAQAQTQAQTQAGGSTWDAIRTRKTLRIGAAPADPWYAKDPATGTWSGLGAALGEQIAKDLDVGTEYVETTYANAPAGLQANQFDIMFVLDPTPARARAIDFPFAPMLYYALGYLTKDATGSRNWAKLDKPETTIAVPIGTAPDRWLSNNMKQATVTRLKNADEAILHYQSGRSKLLVLYHPALLAYRLRIGEGTVIVPQPAVISVAGVGIRREADKTWRDYLTTVLGFYYETGVIEDMYRAYLSKRGLDPATIPGITKESLERV